MPREGFGARESWPSLLGRFPFLKVSFGLFYPLRMSAFLLFHPAIKQSREKIDVKNLQCACLRKHYWPGCSDSWIEMYTQHWHVSARANQSFPHMGFRVRVRRQPAGWGAQPTSLLEPHFHTQPKPSFSLPSLPSFEQQPETHLTRTAVFQT